MSFCWFADIEYRLSYFFLDWLSLGMAEVGTNQLHGNKLRAGKISHLCVIEYFDQDFTSVKGKGVLYIQIRQTLDWAILTQH